MRGTSASDAAATASSQVGTTAASASALPSSRARNPVSTSPATNAGSRSTRARNARFVVTPQHTVSSSAAASRASAAVARRRVGDRLGEHRVVERRHGTAVGERVVGADAGRRAPADDPPRVRQETLRRILGAQARLDRVAAFLEPVQQLVLGPRQRLAGGDAKLPFDEVDADQRLGHAVLDLQARVHLDEPELAGAVEQELDRPGTAVAHRARDRDRDLAHATAQRRPDRGRGGFLDQLLVAPLQRAVALAEMEDAAVRVGEDLDLDVARVVDRALEQQARVAERGLRFGSGGRERGSERAFVRDAAHAAPAAARRGLDHHRIADAACRFAQRRHRLIGAVVAGNDGNADSGHALARLRLVGHRAHRRGRRADPHQPRSLDRLGERRAFAQESVARVNRFRAARSRRADDLLDRRGTTPPDAFRRSASRGRSSP